MMNSIFPLVLDIHTAVSQASVPVPRGDTARSLAISLCENGKSFDIPESAVAVFTGDKADGTTLVNYCVIERGIIKYYFTEQTASAVGRVAAQIKVYDADGGLITSPRITLVVYETTVTDAAISEDDFTVLEGIIATEAQRREAELLREEAEAGRTEAEAAREEAFANAKFTFEEERAEIVEELDQATEDAKQDIVSSARATVEEETATAVEKAKKDINSTKEEKVSEAETEISNISLQAEAHLENVKTEAASELKELRAYVDEGETELWKNDDLTKEFTAQTIDVSGANGFSDMVSFRFVFANGGGNVYPVPGVLPSTTLTRGQQGVIYGGGTGDYHPYRKFSISEGGIVSFEASTGAGYTPNLTVIPIRIYGITNNKVNIDDLEEVREIAEKFDEVVKKADNAVSLSEQAISEIKKCANALVGTASGEAVTLRDVSPIEHTLDVSVENVMDYTTVYAIKKIGKNLFDYRAWVQFMNDANAVGFPNGIAKESVSILDEACFSYPSWMDEGKTPFNNIKFKPNTRYTFSFDAAFYDPTGEPYSWVSMFYVYYTDGTFDNVTIPYENVPVNTFYHVKYTTKADKSISFLTVTRYGNTRMLYVKHDMQIEEGTAETEHEAYIEPTEYRSDIDTGVVSGVTSLYPTTTLYSDVEGMVIKATYNKDANKVVRSLEERIAALEAAMVTA